MKQQRMGIFAMYSLHFVLKEFPLHYKIKVTDYRKGYFNLWTDSILQTKTDMKQ